MNTYTRRNFIKQSTALAATAGMAGILPGALHAIPNRISPNDQLTIGLIGCKGMGFFNLRNHLKQAAINCGGLCDVDDTILNDRAAEVEKITGKKPRLYRDFRKMLEEKDIDAVIIGTPDHWHCLQMVMACEAGKDVYVEKPMANSIGEAALMVKAAKRYNRVVQVGQQQRSGKHWQTVVDFVQSGKLGAIRKVKCWAWFDYAAGILRVPDAPPPKELDYEMWLGPAPQHAYNVNRLHGKWRFQWDYGGGLMTDWGVHLLDIVLWAMKVQGAPRSVMSSGGIFTYTDHEIETPDMQTTVFDMDDYLIEWEHAAGIQAGLYDRLYGIAFIGQNGTLVVDRSGWEIFPESRNGKYLMEAMPPQSGVRSNHETHAINFIESIKTRKQTRCTVDDGYLAAFFAHAGNIAWRTGEILKWDQTKERFAGSAAANVFIQPKYRKPWKLPKIN